METSKRVKHSEIVGSNRVKKMVSRDALLGQLHKGSLEKLVAFVKGKEYAPLLSYLTGWCNFLGNAASKYV